MNPELHDQFEAAFDREPPVPPPLSHVAVGRKALRRRRLVTGAAGVLGVSILAFGVNILVDDPAEQPSPIERPDGETPAQTERRLTEAALVDDSWRENCGHDSQPPCRAYLADAAPVGLHPSGRLLRTTTGVVIVNQVVDRSPPGGTDRVEVEVRTPQSAHPRWWVLTRGRDGEVTAEVADPSSSRIHFETWASAINSDRDVAGMPSTTSAEVIVGR